MRAYRQSAQAEEDLEQIAILIARRDGIDAALAFIEKLESFTLSLLDAPYGGTAQPHLGDGVRKIGYRKQVTLIFRVNDAEVTIGRIMYQGVDWTGTLKSINWT